MLKELQKNPMMALFRGEDAFLWLPTGFGKSIAMKLCYFSFEFKLGHTSSSEWRNTVLVFSLLMSLMTDQVTSLRPQVYVRSASIHDTVRLHTKNKIFTHRW